MVSYFDIFQIFYINNIVYLSVNLLLFIVFIFIINLYNKKLFSNYLLFSNIIISHFKKILHENLDNTGRYYVIPILSLFFFILTFNLIHPISVWPEVVFLPYFSTIKPKKDYQRRLRQEFEM